MDAAGALLVVAEHGHGGAGGDVVGGVEGLGRRPLLGRQPARRAHLGRAQAAPRPPAHAPPGRPTRVCSPSLELELIWPMERPRPLDPDTPRAAEQRVLRAITRRRRWNWPTDRPRPLDLDTPQAAEQHVLRSTTRRGAEPARRAGSGGGSGAGRTLWAEARARCGAAPTLYVFTFFLFYMIGMV